MDVRIGLLRKLSAKELMVLNCGVGEKTRVSWTVRSNQSILREISPDYSFQKIDANAETPCFWPSDVKTDSLEKTLMLGKIEGRRRRGSQRIRWSDGIT